MSVSIDLSTITDTSEDTSERYQWQETGLSLEQDSTTVIYGRTREIHLLLKAYQQVIQVHRAQTVIVHGESGSGKTALVDQLREPVCNNRGYFVAGKYFQNSEIQEPHSAIMAAFSDLCDLVVQSDDFDEQRRREIQEALGSDGQILRKSITNLSPFLVSSPDGCEDVDVLNEASFANFKVACKTFLHAMSSAKHPIVVFIDDIQWMDEGSRLLVELFLQDKELKNVLLILAYRDEEAAKVGTLFEQGSCKPDLTEIRMMNLEASAVHQIVISVMGETSDQIRELSNLVAKRTLGNPL